MLIMDMESALARFGVKPVYSDLEQIRNLLRDQIVRESSEQGDGDTELMKLACVQLFSAGNLEDVMLIWQAKEASFDSHCSIDVQLLCGAGLAETKKYLGARGDVTAQAALTYVEECEATGDFDRFGVELAMQDYERYYANNAE